MGDATFIRSRSQIQSMSLIVFVFSNLTALMFGPEHGARAEVCAWGAPVSRPLVGHVSHAGSPTGDNLREAYVQRPPCSGRYNCREGKGTQGLSKPTRLR